MYRQTGLDLGASRTIIDLVIPGWSYVDVSGTMLRRARRRRRGSRKEKKEKKLNLIILLGGQCRNQNAAHESRDLPLPLLCLFPPSLSLSATSLDIENYITAVPFHHCASPFRCSPSHSPYLTIQSPPPAFLTSVSRSHSSQPHRVGLFRFSITYDIFCRTRYYSTSPCLSHPDHTIPAFIFPLFSTSFKPLLKFVPELHTIHRVSICLLHFQGKLSGG